MFTRDQYFALPTKIKSESVVVRFVCTVSSTRCCCFFWRTVCVKGHCTKKYLNMIAVNDNFYSLFRQMPGNLFFVLFIFSIQFFDVLFHSILLFILCKYKCLSSKAFFGTVTISRQRY